MVCSKVSEVYAALTIFVTVCVKPFLNVAFDFLLNKYIYPLQKQFLLAYNLVLTIKCFNGNMTVYRTSMTMLTILGNKRVSSLISLMILPVIQNGDTDGNV